MAKQLMLLGRWQTLKNRSAYLSSRSCCGPKGRCSRIAAKGSWRGSPRETTHQITIFVRPWSERRTEMSLGTILVVILILILLGAIPTWPHSRNWGYRPSGLVGLIVLILIILLLMGRL